MLQSRVNKQRKVGQKLRSLGVQDLEDQKIHTSGLIGSRLAKKTFLAIHAALLCLVGLLCQRGGGVISHKSQHQPPAWTSKQWEFTEFFEDTLPEEQQRKISKVCTDRNVITAPQNVLPHAAEGTISWTICLTINSGFYDFFRNWYKHYKLLDLNMDMVLFAEDPIVYEQLLSATFLDMDYTLVVNATNTDPPMAEPVAAKIPPKVSLTSITEIQANETQFNETDDDSSSSQDATQGVLYHEGADPAWNEGIFDALSYEYKRLISKRPTRLLGVLCSGRNVLYIDTDTVLRKNPLPVINKNFLHGVDISIAKDKPKTPLYDHGVDFCTGFTAIKANSEALNFLLKWEATCHDENGYAKNDQHAFNVAYEARWTKWKESNANMVRVEGLPSELFPNGNQYFQLYNESQREQAILVHANWMVGGATKKLSFMKHGLWYPE